MKLKPRQIIGLVGIFVFGGIMIMRITQPSEREIMAERLASLPTVRAPVEMPDLPPVNIPSINGPTAPESVLNSGAAADDGRPIWEMTGVDYFNIGSQGAKDDLYCAGVLGAEFTVVIATAHPDAASLVLRDSEALEAAGVTKLKAEGHATDNSWAGFTLAWADKAQKDYTNKTPRLSVADCTARAKSLSGAPD
jgi:hypothetical protein